MSRRAKIFLPVAVVLVGVLITTALVRLRPPVERREVLPAIPLVRVEIARPQTVRLDVYSQGTVRSGIESALVAQVGGKIEWVSPSFAAGGQFRRGTELVRIESADFRLAVSQAEAEVARARTRVALEAAEAEQARRDWDDLGRGDPTELTLREPQLAEARAALEGAEATLEQARLALERTVVTAPYDGRVRATAVDIGQFVAPGTPLAELFSTEYAEVRLPVTKADLEFLSLDLATGRPAQNGTDAHRRGTPVELSGELGGETRTWSAYVVRAGGEFDPKTRMLPLFARIDDPFGRRGHNAAPLPMGLFVEAAIAGRTVDGVVVLPRSALRDEDQILVVDDEDRLRFRQVEVLRIERERLLVEDGLDAGERICVSPLESVVDGMSVRVLDVPADQPSSSDQVGQELL